MITGSGRSIPCSDAVGGPYGNLCNRAVQVKKNCPVTCGLCKATPAAPSPPPAKPSGTAICGQSCQNSESCAQGLFCCPRHKMCMDRSTGSTRGPTCDARRKGGSPPPPPPPSRSDKACRDAASSGLKAHGKDIPCSSVKGGAYGNLCGYA